MAGRPSGALRWSRRFQNNRLGDRISRPANKQRAGEDVAPPAAARNKRFWSIPGEQFRQAWLVSAIIPELLVLGNVEVFAPSVWTSRMI